MKNQNNANETAINERFFTSLSDKDGETNWTLTESDLLFDLKCLIEDYFVATLTADDGKLKICFENNQSFIIAVQACA